MLRILWVSLLTLLSVFFIGCGAEKTDKEIAREAIDCAVENGSNQVFGMVITVPDFAVNTLVVNYTREQLIRERDRLCD